MHESAKHHARLFFETYCDTLRDGLIIEIGSLDVNGSLREVAPPTARYIGLDFVAGRGVDVVLTDPYSLPLESNSADVVVSSSCLEHSQLFWLAFLEMARVVKPGGLIYLNAPSNGDFHRYPVDCWRFYPDASTALSAWAKRNGHALEMLESFIGLQHSVAERWNDFVAVYGKGEYAAQRHPRRIVQRIDRYYNGQVNGREDVLNKWVLSEDQQLYQDTLRSMEEATAHRDALAVACGSENDTLRRVVAERDDHIASTEAHLAEMHRRLDLEIRKRQLVEGYLNAISTTENVASSAGTRERRRKMVPLLIQPTARVQPVEDDLSLWLATDDDPQFEIGGIEAFAGKWVRLIVEVASEGGWSSHPVLYFDCGSGYSEIGANVLPQPRAGESRIKHVFKVPRGLVRARLDPVGQSGRFRLGPSPCVQRLSKPRAAFWMARELARRQGWGRVLRSAARALLPVPTPKRIRAYLRQLATDYERSLNEREHTAAPSRVGVRAAGFWSDKPTFAYYKTKREFYRLLRRPQKVAKYNQKLRALRATAAYLTHRQAVRTLQEQIRSGAPHRLSLPISAKPAVSVIIPLYGKLDYTLRCLASIAANLPSAPFEVILVDDGSPDDSFDILSKVGGIRLFRNRENQGFIRSCNAGAEAARGEFLYFLNNDTEVTPGWLDELLRTFDEFPGTGLAGSKLIYPDGRLQEAGGIIWKDASAWNFGRFQDPLLPVFNYAREVDYCSGASIMVPRKLFAELGGFDERYLPAYCEDSDLALKIRERGQRVIYQPLSTVIHHEGITSGTDTSQGVKAYQIDNTRKLFERWRERLQTHQEPGIDADAAKDRRATRRALVIDHCTPTPNQDAGSLTVFNLLLLLREMDFQVTFIPEHNFLYMPQYTTALQRAGVEVLYAPYVTAVEQHLNECGQRYDLAFLFRPGVVERHLKTIRKCCPKAKVLYHTVDLHFLRMAREAELVADKAKQRAADEMKQRELAAIRAADASIVHSTAELEMLQPMLAGAKLHVFPLIMDAKGSRKTFAERRDIVFIGGYQHAPNVDAVKYFAEEVMPVLRKQLPSVRFYAVGSKPPADIQVLASEDVIITGFVEDLTSLLDKMRVSVAPLRYGAGIKGKIGTAMTVGLPVVATSLAAEGMSLTDGENILVADGPEALANAVARIYQDETLWNHVSQTGLEFADKAWGAETAWNNLAGILRELSFNPVRGNRQLSLYACCSSNSGVEPVKRQKLASEVEDVYREKIKQELSIYEKQVNVHDLPDIYHYWSNKYLAPIFRDAGFETIDEFFSSNFVIAAKRTRCVKASFLSVGAGNCDVEVSVAKIYLTPGSTTLPLSV